MKRILITLLACALVLSCGSVWAAEEAVAEDEYNGYIVTLRDDAVVTLSADAESLGYQMYLVDTPEEALAFGGAVAAVEPNYRVHLFTPTQEPGYIGYSLDEETVLEQWYLKAYPGLGMADVWDELDGSGVTVAVLDTGLYTEHSDFSYTNIVKGYDATHDGGTYADVRWHGTAVTGVIAASLNGSGIVGAAYGASIMPIRVFDYSGDGYVSYIVAGIKYAVDNGADIINMSLGTESKSTSLATAINKAVSAGVIVIASAGNDGNAVLNYPAAFDDVVGVGAVGRDGEVAEYSQKNQSVWVTAPGTAVWSTYSQAECYVCPDGTSFSAPCVTALAALAKQYANEHNQALTPAQFFELLRLAAVDAGDVGYNYRYGHGIVSAANMRDALEEKTVNYVLGSDASWPGEAPTTNYVPYYSDTVRLTNIIPKHGNWFFGGWYDNESCTGDRVRSFVPSADKGQRIYYANWIENVTELASVTLSGYPAEKRDEDTWVAYLPYGTEIPQGVNDVSLTYAYSGTVHTLGHKITKSDDGWLLGMTQNTSNDIYEDTYYLIADNTTYHAPTRLAAQVEGTATPMSLDGATDPVLYTAVLSQWFTDGDGDELSYTTDDLVGLEITDGILRYKPPVAVADRDVSFAVMASDARFSGESVTVTVHVGSLPLSTPLLQTSGMFDAAAPESLRVGYTSFDNTLEGVRVNGSALTEGTDYTVFNGELLDKETTAQPNVDMYPTYVELRPAYLQTLSNGEHTVTLRFTRDSAQDVSTTFTVTNSCVGGHSWDNGEITTEPTCTEDGEMTYTCLLCGAVQTEAVPALEHSYANGACTRCGAKDPSGQTADDSGSMPGSEAGSTDENNTGSAGENNPGNSGENNTGNAGSAGSTGSSGGTAAGSGTKPGAQTQRVLTEDGNTAEKTTDAKGNTAITVSAPGGAVLASIDLPAAPTGGKTFVDVAERAWYQSAVAEATAYGLFNGTSDKEFSPNAAMTRGMLMTVLYNLSGKPAYGANRNMFTDTRNQWYTGAVNWGYQVGIASGNGVYQFAPEQGVTREQMVTFLYRYANLLGMVRETNETLDSFPDRDSASTYAADALQWAVAEGLLTGRGAGGSKVLAPQGTATRAETAAVLTRFLRLLRS